MSPGHVVYLHGAFEQGGADVDLSDPDNLVRIVRNTDPRDLVNALGYLERQDWFDRLKAEAIRLGVKP